MTLRLTLQLILLAASLAPSICLAGPTVVYGPGLDSAVAASRAKAELDTGDFVVAGALASLVEGEPESLALVGGAVSRCERRVDEVVGGVVVSVRDEVIEMEYESALDRLAGAIGALPCGAVGATRDELYELLFLQGQAAFMHGDQETAAKAFGAAVVIEPKRPWDDRLPPTMKDAYFAALQKVFDREPLIFDVDVDGLTIDGAPLAAGDRVKLLPGRHLVGLGNEVVALQVPQQAERTNGLATTNGKLVAGLAAGESRYAPWLAAYAAEKGWDEVVVITGDALHRLDGLTFQGRATSTAVAPLSGAGMTAMGAGLAVTGVGLALHLTAWDNAGAVKGDDGTLTVLVADGDAYDALVAQNHAGLALAIAGGAAVGVGAVLTVVGTVRQRQGFVSNSAPWVTPLPEGGVALGIGGRF